MFDVYAENGELRARVVYAEDAAALAAVLGDGTTIRTGRRILWTEGADGYAGESYDHVAEVCAQREGGAA